MPSTTTTGSNNIAVLDSRIVADLCAGIFYIDATPSVFIGAGAGSVLGARIKVTNPIGVVVKGFASGYDIVAPFSSVFQFPIPTQGGNYQYGSYIIDIKIVDANNKEYIVSKTVKICVPDSKYVNRKYGSLSATLKGSCKDGTLNLITDTIPNYNGYTFASSTQLFTLEFPTSSGISPITPTVGNFSVQLYEGVYKFKGDICAAYSYGDNVSVKVSYKVKSQKEVKCVLDFCGVYTQIQSLQGQLKSDCTEAERETTFSTILSAVGLLKTIDLAGQCGEDPSDYITDLEKLLGCTCTCNTADGTPIINQVPNKDFVIAGCNITKTTNGLTDTYTIDNFQYTVDVEDNGGALVISSPTVAGCVKTQKLTFSVSSIYSQIKTIINNSAAESNYWSTLVSNNLITNGVKWEDIGLTPAQISTFKLPQFFQALIDKIKACCGCIGKILTHTATSVGNNILIGWTQQDSEFIDVFVNNVFYGSAEIPVSSMLVLGGANGVEHTYKLIPRCANGNIGFPYEGKFNVLGCPAISPLTVSSNNVTSAACPYDLTTLVSGLIAGITAEWHSANNTNPNTIVADPTKVSSGSYWLFAKDSNGCFSSGVNVAVLCQAAISCTAPQNVIVSKVNTGFLVQFQSASNPPAGNTYLVRRRLSSDADVSANYTVIGGPVWNASSNRWEIVDSTGLDNIAYVYRAQSQCADTSRPYMDANFANIICPVVTLTPSATGIGYSFVNVGGGVNKYEVNVIEERSGVALVTLHTDTIVPAFANPISGAFTGLQSGHTYYVQVKVFIGSVFKECALIQTATVPPNTCPDVIGIGGVGSAA